MFFLSCIVINTYQRFYIVKNFLSKIYVVHKCCSLDNYNYNYFLYEIKCNRFTFQITKHID